MQEFRALVKFILFALISALYLTCMGIMAPLKGRRLHLRLVSFFARAGAWALGVRPRLTGRWPAQGARFLVCNHLSYLDVLALYSFFPAAFVTSVEVKNMPFLGWLCRLGGCVFVERRSRAHQQREVGELETVLRQGQDVLVFPEATSTNGDEVIRFRAPLFQACIHTGAPVLPITLNYVGVDAQDRDRVFWYGDMTFLPHLWAFLKGDGVDLEVCVGERAFPAAGEESKDLAARAWKSVRANYRGVVGSHSPWKINAAVLCPDRDVRPSADAWAPSPS